MLLQQYILYYVCISTSCLKQNLKIWNEWLNLHLAKSHIGVSVVMMSWTIMAQQAWTSTSSSSTHQVKRTGNLEYNADHEMCSICEIFVIGYYANCWFRHVLPEVWQNCQNSWKEPGDEYYIHIHIWKIRIWLRNTWYDFKMIRWSVTVFNSDYDDKMIKDKMINW